jgi:hypothetical protein
MSFPFLQMKGPKTAQATKSVAITPAASIELVSVHRAFCKVFVCFANLLLLI